MHFSHLSAGLREPLPRNNDEDEDDDHADAELKKANAPVSALIQRKFLDQRKIFLWGPVTDESAKDITEKLLFLELTAPGQPITFYINTPGGSITAGMAVYDTMQLVTSPITVVVTGMAASMGFHPPLRREKRKTLHLPARPRPDPPAPHLGPLHRPRE